MATLAGEGQEAFTAAVFAFDAGEAIVQVTPVSSTGQAASSSERAIVDVILRETVQRRARGRLRRRSGAGEA